MELIFSEPFSHKEKIFRLSLQHHKGQYPIKVFLDNKIVAEFETNLTKSQVQSITLTKTITEPLASILVQAKNWISENF